MDPNMIAATRLFVVVLFIFFFGEARGSSDTEVRTEKSRKTKAKLN